MSTFAVKIRRITIMPHPNADKLELGQVDDYRVVIGKDQFKDGELVAYIPEQAVLGPALIHALGLEGRLDGKEKNRVRAVRLRGELSQGLLCPLTLVGTGSSYDYGEGDDVTELLGITKYAPPIPVELAGKVRRPRPPVAPPGVQAPVTDFFRSYTDIENIKNFPDVLREGETVVMYEKLHGTCLVAGIINGEMVVSSKGIAQRGFVLEEAESNTYWKVVKQYKLEQRITALMKNHGYKNVILFGEIIGVQDLMYGLKKGELVYNCFDIYVEDETGYHFLVCLDFGNACEEVDLDYPPMLYIGAYSKEKLIEHTSGNTRFINWDGDDPKPVKGHIREGLVVRPIPERDDDACGRIIFKSVSPEYLTRKHGTELE